MYIYKYTLPEMIMEDHGSMKTMETPPVSENGRFVPGDR